MLWWRTSAKRVTLRPHDDILQVGSAVIELGNWAHPCGHSRDHHLTRVWRTLDKRALIVKGDEWLTQRCKSQFNFAKFAAREAITNQAQIDPLDFRQRESNRESRIGRNRFA